MFNSSLPCRPGRRQADPELFALQQAKRVVLEHRLAALVHHPVREAHQAAIAFGGEPRLGHLRLDVDGVADERGTFDVQRRVQEGETRVLHRRQQQTFGEGVDERGGDGAALDRPAAVVRDGEELFGQPGEVDEIRKVRLADGAAMGAEAEADAHVFETESAPDDRKDIRRHGYGILSAMPDSLAKRGKFGVLAPSTNTCVQPEFDALRPWGITHHHSRLVIPDSKVTDDASFMAMMDNIRSALFPALESVLTCDPDYVILGMSSETFWDGIEGSNKLQRKLEKTARRGVAMGSDACRAALRAYGRGIRRLGVVTPYMPAGDRQV